MKLVWQAGILPTELLTLVLRALYSLACLRKVLAKAILEAVCKVDSLRHCFLKAVLPVGFIASIKGKSMGLYGPICQPDFLLERF